MCSVTEGGETANTDLTARARIRDAAIDLFGSNGFASTSVRAIAERAGVSAALVIHHFGSKEALRRACDTYVVEDLIGAGEEALYADIVGTMRSWLAEPNVYRSAFDYVARMLVEPSGGGHEGPADTGAKLFADLVKRTEQMIEDGVANGTMRGSAEPAMRALIVALHGLAPLVLQHQVGSFLGRQGLGADVLQRMTIPTLELYTHGLYADDRYLVAARSALGSETP